jgi:thiol-disulfide isomerase/thioredoxin
VRVVSGVFQIKKKLPVPVEASLSVDKMLRPAPLFLESAVYKVSITDSIRMLQYPQTYSRYLDFVSLNNALSRLFPIYGKLSAANDTAGLKKLSEKFDSINQRSATLAKRYFEEEDSSALSLFLFEKFASMNVEYELNEPYYRRLPKWAKESERGKVILEIIEGAKRTRVGTVAPTFVANDTLGLPLSLSSLKGKYVLVDFWASWCKPCRAQNPELLKAYTQYAGKGFDILGVALEYPGGKSSWTKAIVNDGLPWKQVSNFAFFNDPVAKMFGVQAIPRNFLLDPEGRIIARDLSGASLFKRLKEILGQP